MQRKGLLPPCKLERGEAGRERERSLGIRKHEGGAQTARSAQAEGERNVSRKYLLPYQYPKGKGRAKSRGEKNWAMKISLLVVGCSWDSLRWLAASVPFKQARRPVGGVTHCHSVRFRRCFSDGIDGRKVLPPPSFPFFF